MDTYRIGDKSIHMNYYLPDENDHEKGISFDWIGFHFEYPYYQGVRYDLHSIHELLLNHYAEEIKKTADYQKAYQEAVEDYEKILLKELSKEDLLKMVQLCSKEEIEFMLKQLEVKRVADLY